MKLRYNLMKQQTKDDEMNLSEKTLIQKYYYQKGAGQTCFICGEPATTGDHIPPKGLFTTSLRKQFDYKPLKVPACSKHNNSSKKDDEYVRLVLAAGAPENKYTKKLFNERILPRAQEAGGSGLMTKLYKQMVPTFVKRPSGILTIGYKFEIEEPRLQNVVNKITHGLYWHHNGHRIPECYDVSRYSFNRVIPENQISAICTLPILSVGHPSVFEYRYTEVGGDPNSVYIAMMIYESLLIEVAINKIGS
jgi:hypothetical protein